MIASSSRLAAIAASDAVAIVAFVTVGLASHEHGVSVTGYAQDALPILGAWFGVALLLGTYRVGGWQRLLATWAIGVPLGVLVRALVLGRSLDDDQLAFLGVALAFSLLFVLALRSGLQVLRARASG
jgi:hypothetical protein